ncbi:Hypothetical protein NTJ_07817 [Nesidiocoris tenuis]|uniref:Uncharacterized protein n=1 Tax=Nesidiocoris tenuis TaxID=355587 RepID=A0ABN7AS21_9HEMI|nr:Hypothetical protein NTJ_07817 [Nesidiocoris tenuis]
MASSGIWSLGVIRVAAASLTSFGATPSLLAVGIAFMVNSLCAFCFSHENHKAKFSCPLANWLEQLSLLCWVAATSTELSSYLDYYDDLQHHSYLHLVPIDVFPRVMPLVVVFVICALFALGLESSNFLHKVSSVLLWCTFTLFGISCVTIFTINFGEFTFRHDTLERSILGAAIWASFSAGSKGANFWKQINCISISSTLFAGTLIILSSLTASRNGDLGGESSLLEPLGTEYPWYRLVMVPTISCSLGMALYEQYIPAVHSVAQKTPIPQLSKENRITGTKLLAITLVGAYCCILIYLYSPGQLILTGSAASLSSKAVESLYILFLSYSPSSTSARTKKSGKRKTKGEYEAVTADDASLLPDRTLSSDSGHSTDTDIDEIVHEYKVNTQMIKEGEYRKPTKNSRILSSAALTVVVILALLLSRSVRRSQFGLIPWTIAGIAMMYVVLYFQPSRTTANCRATFLWFMCLVCTTVLFGAIIIAVWTPLLLWVTLGLILMVHHDVGATVSTFGAKKTVERLHRLTLQQLPAPRIEIKLHAIQLRNKPV